MSLFKCGVVLQKKEFPITYIYLKDYAYKIIVVS